MAKKPVRRKPAKKAARKKPPSSRKKTTQRRAKPKEPSWLKSLRRRKQPLSLAIEEDGEIAFWKYSFNGPHDFNLMVWHPEGDLDFGFDDPSSTYDEATLYEWDNQYQPGHPIHDAMTPRERKLLGIRQGDVGGPASGGFMVVTVECTLDDLNAIIRQKKLPFVVVKDKRFEKPSQSVLAKK
jgi:hypothetical protein